MCLQTLKYADKKWLFPKIWVNINFNMFLYTTTEKTLIMKHISRLLISETIWFQEGYKVKKKCFEIAIIESQVLHAILLLYS